MDLHEQDAGTTIELTKQMNHHPQDMSWAMKEGQGPQQFSLLEKPP